MRKSGTAATIIAQLNKANLPGKLTNRTYIIKPINVSIYWDKPVSILTWRVGGRS